MNEFSLSDILSRAAQTTWKHKTLWIIPAIVMLLSLLSVPITMFFNPVFAPMLFPTLARVADAPWFSLIGTGFNLCLSVVGGALGIAIIVFLTVGALRTKDGVEKLDIPNLVRESLPYLLRVLGIGALFFISFFIVWMGLVFIGTFISILTLGLGFLCFMPLIFLLIPAMLIAYGWVDLSYAAVIIENLNVFDALKRGWTLYKQNFWKVLLVIIVVYVGLMMIVGITMMPVMLPFFVVPFAVGFTDGGGFSNDAQMRNILLITSLCAAAYAPIYAIIQGAVMTFMRATWTFTFLGLTARPDLPAKPVQSIDATLTL